MQAVGLRELKAKLGEYVRKAAAGEIVLVTERGRVVAELRAPITTRELPPEMAGRAVLAERGLLTLGLPGKASHPSTGIRVPAGTAKRLLDEEREER